MTRNSDIPHAEPADYHDVKQHHLTVFSPHSTTPAPQPAEKLWPVWAMLAVLFLGTTVALWLKR